MEDSNLEFKIAEWRFAFRKVSDERKYKNWEINIYNEIDHKGVCLFLTHNQLLALRAALAAGVIDI